MKNNNKIYDNYNKERATDWEPMPLADMIKVIDHEAKRCTSKERSFHKVNLVIASALIRKQRNGETVYPELISRLGAWQHAKQCDCEELFTVVGDILRLGVKVPCEMMKEAAKIHCDYEDHMAFDSIVEAAYMANGLDV